MISTLRASITNAFCYREKMPRDFYNVIKKILALVPDDRNEVRLALKSILDSYKYSAPEGQNEYWSRAAYVLQKYIPVSKELKDPSDWRRQILNIFNGKENKVVAAP